MSAEDRLDRVLRAPAAPPKDMHFTLQVMREAEARRFRAETARRLVRGVVMAGLAVAVVLPVAVWAASNADAALDLMLGVGAAVAGMSLLRGLRRAGPAGAR